MDEENLKDLKRISKGSGKAKVELLSKFSDGSWISVPDPWYTGNFDHTYELIYGACNNLIRFLK